MNSPVDQNRPAIQAGAPLGVRDPSDQTIFLRQWGTYRKVVAHNLMFHREAYALLLTTLCLARTQTAPPSRSRLRRCRQHRGPVAQLADRPLRRRRHLRSGLGARGRSAVGYVLRVRSPPSRLCLGAQKVARAGGRDLDRAIASSSAHAGEAGRIRRRSSPADRVERNNACRLGADTHRDRGPRGLVRPVCAGSGSLMGSARGRRVRQHGQPRAVIGSSRDDLRLAGAGPQGRVRIRGSASRLGLGIGTVLSIPARPRLNNSADRCRLSPADRSLCEAHFQGKRRREGYFFWKL